MNTPLEPVGVEDLARLRELDGARVNLSMRLGDLELEKITILAALKRIKEEQDNVFNRIASERGVADANLLEINPRTGEVATTSVEKSVQGAPEPVSDSTESTAASTPSDTPTS
jgi:serine/threonine protein kinase HipA of HipAB toxin-antitoxin module